MPDEISQLIPINPLEAGSSEDGPAFCISPFNLPMDSISIQSKASGHRPQRGGTQLKPKFHETASFIVTKPNGQRSVSLMLWQNGKVRPSGNVTIPPNHEIPKPGEIVECRYLYAFKESGLIYQPVFLGKRDDIVHEECTTAQLKYKAESMKLAA